MEETNGHHMPTPVRDRGEVLEALVADARAEVAALRETVEALTAQVDRLISEREAARINGERQAAPEAKPETVEEAAAALPRPRPRRRRRTKVVREATTGRFQRAPEHDDGAQLIAVQMSLSGFSREDAEARVRQMVDTDLEVEQILESVYGAARLPQ